MEQSISLASEVQKSFSAAKRVNRGVRQAGFLVLRKTSMPSILVELGYISNSTEERFLASSAGQQKLATSIYNAFTKYKWEYDRKRGALANPGTVAPGLMPVDDGGISVSKPKVEHLSAPAGSEEDIRQRRAAATESASPKQVVAAEKTTSVRQPAKGQRIFKVQILTSDKKLSPGSKLFKGYKDVDFYVEKGIYKYTYGETTSFDEIKKIRRKVAKDFKDAFIVAFRDGKKVKY